MLLRQVMKHVADQNWVAVALDFAIVVIGVFVGIQVSNWNAARLSEQRAEDFMHRIHEDISDDITGIESRLAFMEQIIVFGEDAIAYAEADGTDGGWPMVVAFYQASQIWPFQPNATTYEELLGAGEIGLIRNDMIREELADYYNVSRAEVLTLDPDYRKTIREITPYPVQRYVWANCHDHGVMDQRLIDCASPVSDDEADAILASFKANPEALDQLRFWMTIARMSQDFLELKRTAAMNLQTEIEADQHW